MSLFWKIVDTLDPDPDQTQIVMGLLHGGAPEKRLELLGSLLADELAGCLREGEEGEVVLVLATQSRGCQDLVMRLSEMGVKQLHAIHPRKPGGADSLCKNGTIT